MIVTHTEAVPDEVVVEVDTLLKYYFPGSKASLNRLIKVGDFPAPFMLSRSLRVWRLRKVLDWLNEKERAGAPQLPRQFRRSVEAKRAANSAK